MQLSVRTVAINSSVLFARIAIGGLLFLGACSSGTQTTTTTSSSATAPATTSQSASSTTPASGVEKTAEKTTAAKTGAHGGQGGQIIESGPYHLELLTVNEADGTHIDFFLQKGDNHNPIPNARVTAQVQRPDGSQKALDLTYDASGKHYYTVLPGAIAGEYKIVILSDIQGEKVNGRFTFSR